MKKRMIQRVFALTAALLLLLSPATKAYANVNYVYDGYTYDFWGASHESPAAFALENTIDNTSMTNFSFSGIDDVSTSKDGRIFLCDKTSGRINIFNADGEFLVSLRVLKTAEGKIALDADGNQVTLSAPTGTYYHEKNQELYIADSGNKKVYVLDGIGYYLKRTIERPANLSGVTEFVPSKVTVDNADRIYIVVQSSYEGIIELNEDGSFSRYFGVNVPQINLIEVFWKSLATDTQKQKMGKTYAPAFTNVTMDSEGFVYAVTDDLSAQDVVFRLNSKGENVLREMNLPVVGDLNYISGESKFIDIAVSDYGVYAVLDSQRGRIFLYDYDGQILNVFGGYGNTKGQFSKPTSIAWLGYKLVVTDTDLKCAYILSPTEFGDVALRASEKYYQGKWDEATELFLQCIRLNSNYEVAYVGVGKNYLMKDQYKEAMYYFELGNARTYYSKAFNGYRGEMIKDNFWLIVVIFVGLVTTLVVSEVRYHKKNPI